MMMPQVLSNNQICSPEMHQNFHNRLEDQFSATFNNKLSSVQKQSDAMRAELSPVVPEFFTDSSAERDLPDLPRVPKLNLDKINFATTIAKLHDQSTNVLPRRESTSREEQQSFGDDSKSQT